MKIIYLSEVSTLFAFPDNVIVSSPIVDVTHHHFSSQIGLTDKRVVNMNMSFLADVPKQTKSLMSTILSRNVAVKQIFKSVK